VSNKYEFSKGESVRIKVGVFRAFIGKVSEIHIRKSTLTVIVEVSGKPQSIELTFLEVEKLDDQYQLRLHDSSCKRESSCKAAWT
jgi:transcription antitermination factor NusG